jgi:toxin CptA
MQSKVKTRCDATQHPAFWLAVIWLLTLPALWYSLNAAHRLRVDVGQWGDHAVLRGVHGREANPFEDYRWTEEYTSITFPNLSDQYRILQIRAHGWRPEGIPPPWLRVVIAERWWGAFQTEHALRTYTILLPGAALRSTAKVSLTSETYTPSEEMRSVGIAIDWIALRALNIPGSPITGQFVGQALLLGLTMALIVLLALPEAATAAGGLRRQRHWLG